MGSWIGYLSGFMKYVEFSYNQIESRMKIKKREFFMYFLRCLNGNSFTSRERLQSIRILRNVSLKKTPNLPESGPQTCHGGLRTLDPVPPFRNVKFVMISDARFPHPKNPAGSLPANSLPSYASDERGAYLFIN